jgi:predicted PurR-regulated permease PerM
LDAVSVRGRARLLVTAVVLVLLLLFVYSVADLLILLFLAVLFSIYLGSVTDWFQRRLRLPRPAGIVVSVLATLLFVGGIGVLLAPPLTAQAAQLVTALPRQLTQWERSLTGLGTRYPFLADLLGTGQQGGSYFGTLFKQIGQYVTGAVPYVFNGIWFLVHVVSLIAISVYLTTRPGLYRSEVLQLVPPRHRDAASDIMEEMSTALRSWLGGQLLAMFVLGALTWLGLQILRVPFALAFGVFAGVVAIVPFFGTLFSTVLPALYVLPDHGIVFALIVTSVGAGVHLLEANIVSPVIFEERVELPPAWTLLALLIMVKLLGVIGLLVAVPVLACVRVLVHRIYIERILEGARYLPRQAGAPVTVALPGGGGLLLAGAGRDRSTPDLLEEQEGARPDARSDRG